MKGRSTSSGCARTNTRAAGGESNECRMQNAKCRIEKNRDAAFSDFCVLRSAFCIHTARAESPNYEVYAIRYATIPDFPVAGLVADADKTRKLDIAMMVWLVRGGGRNILVDTGFYRPQFFKSWTVRDFIRPDEAVAGLGVKPEEVTDVILTHAHWDHADGTDLFPKAQVWFQKDEYAYYTGDAWQPGGKHGGIEPEDVDVLLKTNLAGRLHLVDGDREILPGVHVYIGGKHTWQSQYVSVATRS